MTPMNAYLYTRNSLEEANKWFLHRIDFFKEYTVPSIESQTCRDFKWLVYVDDQTPTDHMEMIIEACSPCSDVYEIIIGEWGTKSIMIDWLMANGGLPDWLITTRFDNDDCMKSTLVETVQNYFNEHQRNEVINFRANYKIDHIKGFGRIWRANAPNSFISLIEPATDVNKIKIVNSIDHGRAKTLAEVFTVDTTPMFGMVVHGRNMANKMNNVIGNPVTIEDIKKEFWG